MLKRKYIIGIVSASFIIQSFNANVFAVSIDKNTSTINSVSLNIPKNLDLTDTVYINILDENLKSELNKVLKMPLDSDITQAQLESITSLSLMNLDIANLEGIQYCVNLNELDLTNTKVKDIKPLENLTNLIKLEMSYTQISDISPLKNLVNLNKLDLSSTNITTIEALENLTNLTNLNLGSTSIDNISILSKLENLTKLYLSSTKVSNIDPLKNLTNLNTLHMYPADVSDISPLKNLTNLSELYLSFTNISNISPLKDLTSLTNVILADQRIVLPKMYTSDGNIEIKNNAKDINNLPIKVINLNYGGVYDEESDTLKWSGISSNTNLRYEFDHTININGRNTKFSGVVTQPVEFALNNPPIIHAVDKTIKVGDVFNALDGVTATDVEDDDSTLNIKVKENTVDTSKAGVYKVVYELTDSGGKTTTKEITVTVENKSTSGGGSTKPLYPDIEELVGEDRFETAIKISNKWNQADAVVISNAYSIVDNLTATPFAYSKNAPMLLSNKDKLNDLTKKELVRLKTKTVYLIGGLHVLDKNIEKELSDIGINVVRIGGIDRFETSLMLAKEIDKINDISKISIVNGVTGLADAVSISTVASENNMPILLVNKKGDLPQGKEFIKSEDIQQSYIIGGINTVPSNVENDLYSLTNNNSIERIAGLDRNETNSRVINKFYTSDILNNLFVSKNGITKEHELIDSLTVGVLAAKQKSPIMLVGSNLSESQKQIVVKKTLKKITKVGGSGNENAFNEIRQLKGLKN